jgi:hypothetical protein
MIQPAAIGAGLPLFKDLAAPLHLELVEANTYASGVAIHVYRPRATPVGQPVDPDQPEQVGSLTSDRSKALPRFEAVRRREVK